MRWQRSSGAGLIAALLSIVSMTSCSRSSGEAAESVEVTPTVAASVSPVTEAAAESSEPLATASTTLAATEATPAPTLPPPETRVSVVVLDEVGTPGLDSDDAFCASWSRFAGSFQVVAVTAAFGSGAPEQLAALEVAASPTVTSAYSDLIANWPGELAGEATLVADDFLGPFARRIGGARDALDDVGADEATIAAISEAWLVALAQRDPSTPEFVVDLPDDVWATIDEAAALFAGQRVPFGSDPSLVTNVATPLTSEYLAVSCPDQGTLSGQEVETP